MGRRQQRTAGRRMGVGRQTWTAGVTPPTSLTPRFGHAAFFDASHRVVVIAGGDDGSGDCSGSDLCADVWTYDGTIRSLAASNPSKFPPRRELAFMYDAHLGQGVLFGGFNGAEIDDTWTWNDTGDGLPQHVARMRSTIVGNPTYTGVTVRTRAAGVGHDATFSRLAGFDVRLWGLSGAESSWTVIGSNTVADAAVAGAEQLVEITITDAADLAALAAQRRRHR